MQELEHEGRESQCIETKPNLDTAEKDYSLQLAKIQCMLRSLSTLGGWGTHKLLPY